MDALYVIVSKVLSVPLESVTAELERENTSEWDSFNHLMLISEIEKEMGVEIPLAQIEHIKKISDLEKIIKTYGPK